MKHSRLCLLAALSAKEATGLIAKMQQNVAHGVEQKQQAKLVEDIMGICQQHRSDAQVMGNIMSLITCVDQSDEMSAEIAKYHYIDPATKAGQQSSSTATSKDQRLLDVMRAQVNNISVREQCCRAIANMALLSPAAHKRVEQQSTSSSSVDANGNETQVETPTAKPEQFERIADDLVEGGAVEVVLGTMASATKCSPKGLAWVASALFNLSMMSARGAEVAARHDGDDIIGTFVEHVAVETTNLLRKLSKSASNGLSAEEQEDAVVAMMCCAIACDRALGAAVRLQTIPIPDRAAAPAESPELVPEFRYQTDIKAVYTLADAATQALRAFSPVYICMRDSDREFSKSSTNEQGSVAAWNAIRQQSPDTVTGILHKGWELLRLLSGHGSNIPQVYEGMHVAAQALPVTLYCPLHLNIKTFGLSQAFIALREVVASQDTSSAVSDVSSLQQYEQLSKFSVEFIRSNRSTVSAAADCLVNLTKPRQDISPTSKSAEGEGGAGTGDASYFLPTEAGLDITAGISSGEVSSFVLAALGCINKQVFPFAPVDSTTEKTHDDSTEIKSIACQLVSVLVNIAESDPVVASLNCVTVLKSMLEHELRRTSRNRNHVLVGKLFSCIWNIANCPEGVKAIKDLQVTEMIVLNLPKRTPTAVDLPPATNTGGAPPAASPPAPSIREEEEELINVANKLTSKLKTLIFSAAPKGSKEAEELRP